MWTLPLAAVVRGARICAALPALIACPVSLPGHGAPLSVSNSWGSVDGDVLPAIDRGIVQDNIGS